jgi:plasmid stabilization system protein ParE
MYALSISDPAEQDIESAYVWWRDNRSAEQAERWYRGIREAIRGLRESADRCHWAREHDLHPAGLRQQLFGIGRRATHRVVFIIENNQVTVLRVRHSAQDALTLEDLP